MGSPPVNPTVRIGRGPVLVLVLGAIGTAAALGYVTGRTSAPAGRCPEPIDVAESIDGAVPRRAPAREQRSARHDLETAAPARPERTGPEPIPAAAVVPVELRDRVAEQVRTAVERMRGRLVERCWDGLSSRGSAADATVTLDLTFDAQGHEIARSVFGGRDDPGVAECVRRLDGLTLSVDPPGTNVGVQLAVTLP